MPNDKRLSQSTPAINEHFKDQNIRHTLPLTGNQGASRNKDKRGPKIRNVPPTIPEGDDDEPFEVVNERVKPPFEKRSDSNRGSVASKRSDGGSRRNSSVNKKHGHDNPGFEEGPGIFEIGNLVRHGSTSVTSVRSSIRDPSERSLTVIKEQYCCCSRWSNCEKILMISVGILGIIILGLVAVVGYMASNKGVETAFNWSF